MSCQAAGPLGAQAADTVLSRIAGEAPGRASNRRSSARASASAATPRRCRSRTRTILATRVYISGRLAASVKEAICKGTLWGLRREARKPGRPPVFKGDKRSVQSDAAARRWSRTRDTDEHAERFTHLRPLLFTIVYEILGSATESDDVLQDSYLRWAEVDLATVRDTKSYLAQLVTRQALNALRAGARRREEYIGPWLPEPLLLDDRDASADVVLAESVSMAMLVLLETLTPDERAVFVLREVFGFDYDEIAGAVGKSAAFGASGGAPRPRTRTGAA